MRKGIVAGADVGAGAARIAVPYDVIGVLVKQLARSRPWYTYGLPLCIFEAPDMWGTYISFVPLLKVWQTFFEAQSCI